jgi:hypothetical protein
MAVDAWTGRTARKLRCPPQADARAWLEELRKLERRRGYRDDGLIAGELHDLVHGSPSPSVRIVAAIASHVIGEPVGNDELLRVGAGIADPELRIALCSLVTPCDVVEFLSALHLVARRDAEA